MHGNNPADESVYPVCVTRTEFLPTTIPPSTVRKQRHVRAASGSATTVVDKHAILPELPRLRRYARALVGDRAAADDLVQDTLERALTRFSQWRDGSSLRSWLFAIMHNLLVDQVRRPKLNLASFDDEVHALSIRATQSDRMELMDLAAALQALPDGQRAVLLLVALEGMSYAEVADSLDIPVGTVMSRLARGRERLRQLLDGDASPVRLKVVR